MARKSNHDEDELEDDDDDLDAEDGDDDDFDDEDDEDTIDLDSAEKEEKDDEDDDEDDDEEDGRSVEKIEARRLFQGEAEEILEHITLEDVAEVLRENEMDVEDAPKLKRFLHEVVAEGEVVSMEEAWEEALTRLEES
ncbi:MAG TPA: hypothetical protein VMU88_09495 [bacterium]|nr:hypothetical protein [bacterium]